MFEKIGIMRMASEMAALAAQRQAVVAGNVANSDTPGYRALDVAGFAQAYRADEGRGPMRATRPGHLGAGPEVGNRQQPFVDLGAEPSPNGNSVSLETEMLKSAGAKREHDMSLAVYKTALDILRTSLGRGR